MSIIQTLIEGCASIYKSSVLPSNPYVFGAGLIKFMGKAYRITFRYKIW